MSTKITIYWTVSHYSQLLPSISKCQKLFKISMGIELENVRYMFTNISGLWLVKSWLFFSWTLGSKYLCPIGRVWEHPPTGFWSCMFITKDRVCGGNSRFWAHCMSFFLQKRISHLIEEISQGSWFITKARSWYLGAHVFVVLSSCLSIGRCFYARLRPALS